jgi:hypothetical protein
VEISINKGASQEVRKTETQSRKTAFCEVKNVVTSVLSAIRKLKRVLNHTSLANNRLSSPRAP